MTMTYPEKVKQMRRKRAWSQEQLADVAGVNVRTIQRIESGRGTNFDTLKAVANAFDVDVADLQAPPEPKADEKKDSTVAQRVLFLARVRTGRELFDIAGGADMFGFDHDELQGSEVDLVASFVQDVHDWGDIWNDIEPVDRVRVPHNFNTRIAELEEAGFWVFAARHPRSYQINAATGAQIVKMSTATMVITKPTNPAIVRLDGDDNAVLPTTYAR